MQDAYGLAVHLVGQDGQIVAHVVHLVRVVSGLRRLLRPVSRTRHSAPRLLVSPGRGCGAADRPTWRRRTTVNAEMRRDLLLLCIARRSASEKSRAFSTSPWTRSRYCSNWPATKVSNSTNAGWSRSAKSMARCLSPKAGNAGPTTQQALDPADHELARVLNKTGVPDRRCWGGRPPTASALPKWWCRPFT
jgi:hypothetical protein